MQVIAGTIFRDCICSKMLQEWEQQGCCQCEINPSVSPASLSCIELDVTKQPKAGQIPPKITCIYGLDVAGVALASTLVSPLCRSQWSPRQSRECYNGWSQNIIFLHCCLKRFLCKGEGTWAFRVFVPRLRNHQGLVFLYSAGPRRNGIH